MLKITPEQGTIRLLSIDPGLNNIGIAKITIDTASVKIISIEPLTIQEDKVIDDVALDPNNASERDIKRLRMVSAAMKNVVDFHPTHVVCESPFFNVTRPSSFAILTEVIASLRDAVASYDPSIPFTFIAPKEAKKILSVANEKGKDPIKAAVQSHAYLSQLLTVPLDDITEHAIDAVVIGFTFFTYFERSLS